MKKILIIYGVLFASLGVKAQSRLYSYDNLGRLLQEGYPDSSVVFYTYDGAGNRLTLKSSKITCFNEKTPVISATGPLNFCQGDSVVLTSSNAQEYTWSNGSSTQSIVVKASGTYSVNTTVPGAFRCPRKSLDVTVTMSPFAANITSSGTASFCKGDSVMLTASPGSRYQWSNGDTTQVIIVKASSVDSVKVTNSNGCSAFSNPVKITVNVPVVPIILVSGPTTFCKGSSLIIGASSSSKYLWSNGATTQYIVVKNSEMDSVKTTDVNGCSAYSAATMIKVNTPVVPVITNGGSTTLCNGNSVKLSAPVSTHYLWSTGDTTQSVTIKTAGKDSVQTTDINGCSAYSAPVTITANTPLIPTITASSSTTFCNGDSVQLSATSFAHYLWSNGDTSQNITVKTSSRDSVKTIDANGCSAYSAPVSITVKTPTIPTITSGSSTTFCQGGSVNLSATAAKKYLWSTGDTTQTISVNSSSKDSVKTIDANGCSAYSAPANVTVNIPAIPTITSGSSTTFCQGGSVNLSATAAKKYLWTTGDTTQSISVNSSSKDSVKTIDANGCSAYSLPTSVTVNTPTTPTITSGSSTTFCQGGSVNLSASISKKYLWSTGDTTQSISVNSSSKDSVKTTDINGCSAYSIPTNVVVNTPVIPTITSSGATSFCSPDSVILTSTKSAHYLWSTGDTIQNIIVKNNAVDSVKTTDANGCSAYSLPITIKAKTAATASITLAGASTFCKGDSVMLMANSAAHYLWSTGDTTQNIIVKNTGKDSVKLTDINGCSAYAKSVGITVHVPVIPVISSGGATTFCQGGSVTLSATASKKYLWSTGDTTQSITVNSSSRDSVKTIDANGCSAYSSVKNIIVNALPSVNAGKDTSICNGSSITIGASTLSGHKYSWTSNPSGFTTTTSNPGVSPASTTTYYLTESITATGCSKSDSVTVTVNPLPTVGIISPTTICKGTSLNIGASSVSGNSYNWSSNPSGFTSSNNNPIATPSLTAYYKLTETITATGCSKTDSVQITVNPSPTISIIRDTAICNGSSISLGSPSISGNTYNWTSNPAGYTSTSSNPSVSPGSTMTYYLTQKIPATGCTKSDSVVITVNPLPSAVVGIASSICMGDSASIGAASVSGSTYAWTSNPAGFTSSAANGYVSPISTTTYYLTETISATGCSKSNNVTIKVKPVPTVNAGRDTAICNGSSVNIGTAAIAGNSYSWTSNPAGYTSSSANPSVKPGTTMTYYLKQSIGTCSKSDSVVITVNPLPAAIAGTSTAICSGDSVSIGASPVTGNKYSWTSNPSGYSDTTSHPKVSPAATTTYTLTETISATGCNKSSNVNIKVNPVPTVNAGASTSICNGNATTIGVAALPGNTYKWTSNPAGYGSTSASPSVKPGVTTTYYLTQSIGTCSKSDSVTITVNPKAIAGFTESGNCESSPTQFTNTSTTHIKRIWYFGDGDTSTALNPSHTYAKAGSYKASLAIYGTGGCYDSTSKVVTIYSSPDAAWAGSNLGAEQYSFRAKDTSLSSASYTWNFGDSTTGTGHKITHTYTKDSSFMVRLTVVNVHNCSSSFDSSLNVFTGIVENSNDLLKLNIYPNPFRNELSIGFTLPKDEKMKISISDMLGKEIAVISEKNFDSGEHQLIFESEKYNLTAGVYFIKVIIQNRMVAQKVIKM